MLKFKLGCYIADDMEMAATAISEEISIEAIIGHVFADE